MQCDLTKGQCSNVYLIIAYEVNDNRVVRISESHHNNHEC